MSDDPIMCVILANETNVVFKVDSHGSWKDPCKVFVQWEDGNPMLKFTPFAIFASSRTIDPINDYHVLAMFEPDEDVQHAYHEFLSAYDRMSREREEETSGEVIQ